jgi:antitoxin (DNA-binding transcriptional repressor) of toxin-antitoxin stability system
VITKRGRRVAAVVPVEMLEEYERLAEAADLAIIRERLARVEAGEPTVSVSEVMAETLERAD